MSVRPDRLFLLVAAIDLLAGALLGAWMGAKLEFGLRPVHAHVNLLGWASMALFGVTYRAFPQLGASRLAWVHFFIALVASICLPIGIFVESIGKHFGAIGIAGAVLWIVSAFLFTIAMIRLALTRIDA